MTALPEIARQIARAPTSTGCYIWKNNKSDILYVGKAINLRSRLRNYLASDAPEKTAQMVSQAVSVEWITTETAREALILEANLVKKHLPRFNVRLKDDKRYPYICVSTSEMYPRLFITRTIREDGNRYYGPYTDVRATRQAIALIHKIFPVRKVEQDLPLKTPRRPCMNFYIKRCLAPCQGNVPVEEYRKIVDEILLFLEGRNEILERSVQTRMDDYSSKLEYEKAGMYRDMLSNLRQAVERQSVMSPGGGDEDILAVVQEKDAGQIALFEVREGRLIGRKSFPMLAMENSAEGEILSSFIRDYYLDAPLLPARITLAVDLPDKKEVELALSEKAGRKIRVGGPRGSESRALLRMAWHNAVLLLRERLIAAKISDNDAGLLELKQILNLNDVPSVMECYDISHFQGSQMVGSGVMFVDGAPHKAGYRHYHIKSVEGINDPASIREVIARRLQKLLNEEKPLPDLIVIDGGVTQLTAACEAAASLGAPNLAMVGLAKKREEIYFPGDPAPHAFDPSSPGMRILRRLRDEAHRFGITFHRRQRNAATLRHVLDSVPDLGPKRKQSILRHFSQTKVHSASLEELAAVPGIGPVLARKIREFLDGQKSLSST